MLLLLFEKHNITLKLKMKQNFNLKWVIAIFYLHVSCYKYKDISDDWSIRLF